MTDNLADVTINTVAADDKVETCGLGGSITIGDWSSEPVGLNGNVKDSHWTVYSFNLVAINLAATGNFVFVAGIGGGHDFSDTFTVYIPPVNLTMTKSWAG